METVESTVVVLRPPTAPLFGAPQRRGGWSGGRAGPLWGRRLPPLERQGAAVVEAWGAGGGGGGRGRRRGEEREEEEVSSTHDYF